MIKRNFPKRKRRDAETSNPESNKPSPFEVQKCAQDNLHAVDEKIKEMIMNLVASHEKSNSLEEVVKEQNKTIDRLTAECGEYKNALKLKKAEIELLRNSVASSSGDPEAMGKNAGTLHECYFRCNQENIQLTSEVGTLKIKLESCQAQCRIVRKNLCDENQELKRKLDQTEEYNQSLMLKEKTSTHKLDEAHQELLSLKTKLHETEINLDELSRKLEAKANDMQDVEALNKVLVAKERKVNDELQEARKKLISGLRNFLSDGTMIVIKRMGELNHKPFQEVCVQKFPGEESTTKAMELCSRWQEEIMKPEWYPFKIIERMARCDEIIDENDDKLKLLKNEWGDQVYNSVCVALAEVNEHCPSGRYAVLELWNFKENRKAQMKEVIEYLLNLVLIPGNCIGFGRRLPVDSYKG